MVAAAALASGCAASPDDERVGERVLPDTRAVAEHFQRAVAMQGPYGFQMPAQPEAWPSVPAARPALAPAAATKAAEPATPSFWQRLWPSPAAKESTAAPPRRARTAAPASSSFWDHFWPPLTPAKTTTPTMPRADVPDAARRTAVAVAPPPRPAVAPVAASPRPADGAGSGLSEFRVGALKHAVSFGDAKEQGMDGNAEALFRSPAWLAWAYAPRPHLGITANASSRATDFLYGGLTWEWTVWDALFVDLGLGLSVHDGMLDNSRIPAKARGDRRELGCRALFRESVEVGYRFLERHSVSLLWAHHGNGSLCGDDNDGIDNAGIRYGLRM